jgi:hypothetical protein
MKHACVDNGEVCVTGVPDGATVLLQCAECGRDLGSVMAETWEAWR